MTILQADKNLSAKLNTIYDRREAGKIADMVMEKISGLERTKRLVEKELPLTSAQLEQLHAFTEQLLQHKPVQYILNEAWFAGMKLYVDENVLIPRPETEELVQAIMEENPARGLTILDIGTGSGCIAIALKKKLASPAVYALEISDKSLNIAEQNAVKNRMDITFLCADILKPEPENTFPLFDIIVSNPPYIKNAESKGMSPNVLLYEPHLALFVPDDDALLFYRAIADFGLRNIRRGSGKIYVEINEIMGGQVAALFKEKGFSEICIRKDMQQKERFVSAVLK